MKNKLLLILIIMCTATSFCLADGVLTLSMGKVDVKKDSSTKWEPVKINATLLSSDTLRIGKNSKAVIKFSDGKMYTINTMKEMKISDIESRVYQNSGKSLSQLIKEKGLKFTKSHGSETVPTAVAGVRGADVDSKKDKVKSTDLKWKE